jgi:hypothetical protein
MANEFIIKNGFRSQGDSEVTGSLSVSGSISTTSPVNLSGFATGSVLFTSGSAGAITRSANLFWDNTNGRLGIGTSTPSVKLEVQGTGTSTPLRVVSSGNTTLQLSRAGTLENGDASLSVTNLGALNIVSANVIRFIPNLAEAMRIGTTGNVLINTTTDAGYKLDVNGTARVKGTGTTSATTALRVENTNASASLVVLDNGNVGIGTTSPSEKLTIFDTSNGSAVNKNTLILNNSGGAALQSTSIVFTNTPNLGKTSIQSTLLSGGNGANLTFNTSVILGTLVNRMTILADGNVGIGTTNPTEKLEVQGSAQIGNDSVTSAGLLFARKNSNQAKSHYFLSAQESPTYQWIEGGYFTSELAGVSVANNSGKPYYESYSPALQAKSFGFINQQTSGSSFTSTAVTASVILYQGGTIALAPTLGNVGIGTISPTSRLQVKGSGATSATTALRVENTNASASLVVLDDGTVGVGTSTTSRTLQVNGSFRVNRTNQTFPYWDLETGEANFGRLRHVSDSNNQKGLTISNILSGATPASSWNYISFDVQNGEALRIDATRNIGIGTISPSASLHILGASSATLLEIDSPSVNNILYVSGSGRVGIGTSSPAKKLDVTGTIRGWGEGAIDLSSTIIGAAFQTEYIYNPSVGTLSIGTLQAGGGGTTHYIQAANTAGTIAKDITLNPYGGNIVIGTTSPTSRLQVRGAGATSATTTFLLQNSSPINLMTVLDNGQTTFSSPTITLATSQSAFTISQSISASNVVGGQYYGVNITPTFFATTSSQTETALRVAATFTGSAAAVGGQNIIADFGATSAGSQFTVTDVTSGSIYMVNDVSGLPIIEATSDWTVNMYNFPNLVFNKTGSQVNIFGTLRVSGSFILPLSQSATPQTGSAYWSGSFLFIYDGTQYRSSSFA